MFSKQVVLLAAAAVASVTAQTTTSTTSAAAAPTEVTDCHAHSESELFCFDTDDEEWELISSGSTADNLPESFEDCHMHDEESHCVDRTTEATLVSASSEDDHGHDYEEDAACTTSAAANAGTTMTSIVSSVATGSINGTASSTSTCSQTTTTSSAPTAVTNCHPYDETELFCLHGSDEWRVTSDWDGDNPPQEFEDCHAHGEQLDCVDGDVDATLVASTEAHVDSESASTTTTGATASESNSAANVHVEQSLLTSIAYTKPWTKNDLLAAFALLPQATGTTTRFCFLIDGLDEFDGDHRDLIDAINLLNRSSVIKICVSSRPWNIFQEAYGSNDDLHITLHSLTKRDIDQYVGARLRMSVPGILGESEIRRLENTLCDKAEGVFLWVTLATRDLRRGIGEHDSVEMLQHRLEANPSELQEFIEHVFNQIDPIYRKLTGRLLLMMLELPWKPPLVSVPFLEDFTVNEDVVVGTQWSGKCPAERHRLVDRAILCANKWCRDLLQPIHAESAHDAIEPVQFHCMDDDDTISNLSFGHRTIHQFVKEKAKQGTLIDMAGHNFSPRLASLYTAVEVSNCALDIHDFADIFTNAMSMTYEMAYWDSVLDADTAKKFEACLAAFDIVGQAMESGADPFVSISSEDLFECYQQDHSARKPTFLTVLDILEDVRTAAVSISAFHEDYPAGIAVWETAIAAFETSLQEAFTRRYAASRSALLPL